MAIFVGLPYDMEMGFDEALGYLTQILEHEDSTGIVPDGGVSGYLDRDFTKRFTEDLSAETSALRVVIKRKAITVGDVNFPEKEMPYFIAEVTGVDADVNDRTIYFIPVPTWRKIIGIRNFEFPPAGTSHLVMPSKNQLLAEQAINLDEDPETIASRF